MMYIWRVVEAVYLKPRPENAASVSEAPLSLLVPVWILALANIYFGANAGLSSQLANNAATALFSGTGF